MPECPERHSGHSVIWNWCYHDLMWHQLFRRFEVWRFHRNVVKYGIYVPISSDDFDKVRSSNWIKGTLVGAIKPEIKEWLADKIHFISVHPNGFCNLYFFEDIDAVDFKLRFL